MNSFFSTYRLYIIIALQVILYVCIFAFKGPLLIGHCFLLGILALVIFDVIQLNRTSNNVLAERKVADQLSLSDSQFIEYKIVNSGFKDVDITIIDELPMQLQHREFLYKTHLKRETDYIKKHNIKPTQRGAYQFGKLHLYISSPSLKLLEKRCSFSIEKEVEVYPSFIQMQKYDLQTFNKAAVMRGIKRVRRIGKTDEFEHIKNYTQGDSVKSINWKATSRKNELMINQFQDTRSQSLYCIIDKGRSMKMPFEKLSLLDYAINSTLVLSNIVLKKYDKAGLITFNDKLGTIIKANNIRGQFPNISKALYNEQTSFKESDFKTLFFHIRKRITRRSILILFSNFENTYDMKRALPYLRQLNKVHLLIVIFFTNTELLEESDKNIMVLSDIYATTFARKALIEKELIAEELNTNGIQVILSKPENLSINVINKYLEIKAKRML